MAVAGNPYTPCVAKLDLPGRIECLAIDGILQLIIMKIPLIGVHRCVKPHAVVQGRLKPYFEFGVHVEDQRRHHEVRGVGKGHTMIVLVFRGFECI